MVSNILTTARPGSPEWHKAHEGRIGGRAAVNILFGGDPRVRCYGTPYGEWTRLTNKRVPERDQGDEKLLAWGNASEGLHRTMLGAELGVVVRESRGTIQHPTIPWMIGSDDGGFTVTPGCCDHLQELMGQEVTVELKAPSRFTWHEWKDETPLAARMQGAYYAMLDERDHVVVSGLLPPETKWMSSRVSKESRQLITDRLCSFWDNHVLKDIPPPAVSEKDRKLVARLFPEDNGEVIQLPPTVRDPREEIERLEDEAKSRETRVEQIKAEFALMLGAAAYGQGEGFVVSHKTICNPGYSPSPVLPYTYRKLTFGSSLPKKVVRRG